MSVGTVETGRLFIGGSWVEGAGGTFEVRNKCDGSLLAVLPLATEEEVESALQAAVQGFEAMRSLPAHARAKLLYETAALIARDKVVLAHTIAAEVSFFNSVLKARWRPSLPSTSR